MVSEKLQGKRTAGPKRKRGDEEFGAPDPELATRLVPKAWRQGYSGEERWRGEVTAVPQDGTLGPFPHEAEAFLESQ